MQAEKSKKTSLFGNELESSGKSGVAVNLGTEELRLLERWAGAVRGSIHVSRKNGLSYYGTGESAHWPVQSNFNVFAALAVLAGAPDLDEKRACMKRDDIRSLSLSVLRYGLSTHLGEANVCTDNGQWGHFWISVLGLERMMHGIDAVEEHLSGDDKTHLKRVLLSEADWILDEHPVVAGIEHSLNKPESNIWNGTFLMRTALTYPDSPRCAAYLDKAAAFLLNGISIPSDAVSAKEYRGKPLSAWHVGPNFTEAYSLNHHNYLNVGYMVICLSNIAMLHFDMKRKGMALPPEVYHHAEDLWHIVKGFTFPDGRLWRIGGDTRARYCYCQDYALPMWLFAAEHFGDDTSMFEIGWLDIVRREMDANGDGYFLSNRLASVRENSMFYYARLESDRAVTLSQAAFWHRHFTFPAMQKHASDGIAWDEEYHGAVAHSSKYRAVSWVWKGADGPAIQCVPAKRSDMAEWQNNLYGELRTAGKLMPNPLESSYQMFGGGFTAYGELEWVEMLPMGEGEEKYKIAHHHVAVAALPDNKTVLIMQHAVATKDSFLTEVKSLGLKMPNDLFNNGVRRYLGDKGEITYGGIPLRHEQRVIDSKWLSIDDELSLLRIYGAESFTIFRPSERRITINRATPPMLGSLYADEICMRCDIGSKFYQEGTVLIDDGFAVSTVPAGDAKRLSASAIGVNDVNGESANVRAVRVTGCDGVDYLFIANFGGPARAVLPRLSKKPIVAVSGDQRIVDASIPVEIPAASQMLYVIQ